MTALPMTAFDILNLTEDERALVSRTIAEKQRTGEWEYPAPTNGDLEAMTRDDKLYWIYKAQQPVTRAVRDSGLEAFFAEQPDIALPVGFIPNAELTLAAAGDLMDHELVPRSAQSLYPGIAALLFDADIRTANLEGVVTDSPRALTIDMSAAPPLMYRAGSFEAVVGSGELGFDFVSTAGNHSLDCGASGVRSTLDALDARGIAHHGTYRDERAARQATMVEAGGLRVAMISHTFGLNGIPVPADQPWIVSRTHLNGHPGEVDLTRIAEHIAHARRQEADLVVGHLHWGLEHEFYPRPAQLQVARQLAELGLDVIIGHHPHVLQPCEHYRTQRDPDRFVPIYYSLGNLVNPFAHLAFRVGGVARIGVARGRASDGSTKTYVSAARLHAVVQEHDVEGSALRIVPAGDEHRRTIPWMKSRA